MLGSSWGDAGWSTIGSYADVTGYQAVSTDVASKYWLIGAYNAIFSGGETVLNGGTLTAGNDGLKLASVKGDIGTPRVPPTDVPEPGTLAIFALAMVGLFGNRRKLALKA